LAGGARRSFTLIYRDVRIGRVDSTREDFPNLLATLTSDLTSDHPDIRHRVNDYIQFWIEADRLARDSPHSLDEFLQSVEPTFSDLINSTEWFLLDHQNVRLPIHAPTLSPDGRMTWRWRNHAR